MPVAIGQELALGARARTSSPSRPSRRRPFRPTPVEVTLFGAMRLCEGGTERRPPLAAQRLLALVVLHGGRLRRRTATEVLWPHLSGAVATGCLRSTLSRLRAISPGALIAGPGDLRLVPHAAVDVFEFERAALVALSGAGTDEDPARFAAELLPEWDDDWVALERERLHELGVHAIEAVAGRLSAEQRYAEAIAAAYRAVRLDPLRESAVRTLVAIHLAEGNRVRAARAYLDFRQRLRAALGVEPSDALSSMITSMLPPAPTA